MSTKTTNTAQNYYDSSDADTFYYTIWGGADIHIGLYDDDDDDDVPSSSIASASERTVSYMASLILPITPSTRILDLGAGYGGGARYLAKKFGCKVVCLNLSEVENERNRTMNKEAGLDKLVDVVQGNFEEVPLADQSIDIVWSQDAFLHSGHREKIIEEIERVLVKYGGKIIFTDPMVANNAETTKLEPILKRLHLDSLGSVDYYETEFRKRGFEGRFEDHTDQLVIHYGRVLQELESQEEQLKGMISDDYIRNMETGLNHWVEGGKSRQLSWGILTFTRNAPRHGNG
ncbi:hypothetical protein ACLMJK_009550 [Lecanora helva]